MEEDWPYDWADKVKRAAGTIADEVPRCTTPEARIWLAEAFNCYLDRLDKALLQGAAW